jgi:hypothetical protein
MRAATTSFSPRSRASSSLARKLAGPTADARRFEAACRLAAPQIDVLDIREARLPLLARALEDRVGPVSILSANEAKFRERSQRVKIQQKQSCKMNGAPIGGKTCGARPYRPARTARWAKPGNVDLWTAIVIAAALSVWQIAYAKAPYTSPFPSQARLHRA